LGFYKFRKIEEKENLKEELYTSVELAEKWFKTAEDEDYIIMNTTYIGLYLLRMKNELKRMEERYKDIKEKVNKKELELFYKYLMEEENN
jgi:hypothetical protein